MQASRSRACITLACLGLVCFLPAGFLAQSPAPAAAPPTLPQSTPQAVPATSPAGTVPSIPAPTPGNLGTFPAIPAGSAGPAPGTSQNPQTPSTPYRDPLEQPIVVAPSSSPNTSSPNPVPAMPSTPDVPAAPGILSTPMPATSTPLSGPPATVMVPMPVPAGSLPSVPAFYFPEETPEHTDALGSTYIPMDSPIYPMALRLYSMGYADDLYLSLRPWTRRSLLHALQKSEPDIMADGNEQATEILARIQTLLAAEIPPQGEDRGRVEGLESLYTRVMGVSGTPLRDSYHLGQTFFNDYGRPYEHGFNNVTGFSSVNEWGRFSLYVRGEFQHAPSAAGYSQALSASLSAIDQIPFENAYDPYGYQTHQDTIPFGPIATTNTFRLQEVTVAYHLLGHEISFGKSDAWLGPGVGGAMAWSNNAEDVYAFRINRVEPMHIPYLQRIIGPIRYDFMVGPLQGHSYPNAPWVNQAIVAIQPYKDFEFSIQKTAIWGGKGHGCLNPPAPPGPPYNGLSPCTEPITIHTFLKSFFDIGDTTSAEKFSRDDPGARFSSATFSWRLPFLRRSVTLYTDSTTHDDDLPVSAPRRAGWRPGIYLSHVPYAPKFDLRVEAGYTDYVTLRSFGGQGAYFETVQKQGYTNKGFIFGDWVGREGKAGQAWLTYHMSPDDFIQVEYMHKRTAGDFIPLGTTQSQAKIEFQRHFRHDLEADAWIQYERWSAPFYLPGGQTDVSGAAQITWWPKLTTMRHAK